MRRNPKQMNGVKSKTFCVLPWKNITTNNNGKIKLCCNVQTEDYVKNSQNKDGNIHEDTIEDLWNSPHIRNIRRELMKGQSVPDCQYCYDMEQQGSKSSRQWANERYLNKNLKRVVQFSLENEGYVNKLPDSLEIEA